MASENFAKINATASSTPIIEGFQGPDEEPAPAGAIADNPNGITAITSSVQLCYWKLRRTWKL